MEEKFISSSFEVLTKENFGNWLESNELYFNPEKINEIWNTLEKNFGTKITKVKKKKKYTLIKIC